MPIGEVTGQVAQPQAGDHPLHLDLSTVGKQRRLGLRCAFREPASIRCIEQIVLDPHRSVTSCAGRPIRLAISCEIVRRGIDRKGHLTDLLDEGFMGEKLPQPYCDVGLPPCKAERPIVGDQLDDDARMDIVQRLDTGSKDVRGERFDGRDANQPSEPLVPAADRALERQRGVFHSFDLAKYRSTRRGQTKPSGCAFKQLRSGLDMKVIEPPAHGRLADLECARRRRQRAVASNREKGLEVIPIEHHARSRASILHGPAPAAERYRKAKQ
ncbi:hypothetical protein BSY18_3936 (plasmid) [Blastomonas sp. RAC04]|nr:hypothetical protein BSY18_3936 [Blastomonas sp. RAC04]